MTDYSPDHWPEQQPLSLSVTGAVLKFFHMSAARLTPLYYIITIKLLYQTFDAKTTISDILPIRSLFFLHPVPFKDNVENP